MRKLCVAVVTLILALCATPSALFAHEGHPHGVVFGGFSNLHPLIVHLPITMLLVAPILQILSVFQKGKIPQWTTLAFVLLGAVGAYLSGEVFHPDTTDLGDVANKILESHEQWADRSQILSYIAVIPTALALFIARFEKHMKVIAFAVLLAAGACIVVAGHEGAKLVHIHGIGAEGNYIKDSK